MEWILKNGLIYDGSKNPPINQDIYIKDQTIMKIGKNLDSTGKEEIDCSGLCIAPGFIDAHSHNDFFLEKEDALAYNLPFLQQGITTQIVGNCGFSAYGINPDSPFKDKVGGGLFKTANPGRLRDFAKQLEGKLVQNIVPLVGHGTTRTSVAGKNPRPLTQEEIDMQMDLVDQAMKDGAFGGSFGLMYQPGMYAKQEELIAFANKIQEYEGIVTVHPRANSKVALGYPLFGKPHIEQGLDEVITIMKKSGVRMQYSHLIFVGKSSWKCVEPMLKNFYQAREAGYDIAYDMYPFTYGASVMTVVLPSWYLKLTKEEKTKPWNRFKLWLIISITKKLLGIEFSDMVVSYIGKDYPQYEGKTVAEIAKEENKTAFAMYLDLVDLSHGHGRMMLGKYYNEDIIRRLMNDSLSIYMTDAWYEETGTQNAGTFQAFPFFLQKTKEYGIPLEETIHKMTLATANRFSIPNRGKIQEGAMADITVFDYQKIHINEKVPHETPEGIRYVFVNGQLIIRDNTFQNTFAGEIILKNNHCRLE